MIYDCFTLRDELDMLELRMKILDDKVDYFVFTEANYTHRGDKKEYNYLNNIDRFAKWGHKIIYSPLDFTDIVNKAGIDFSFQNSHKDQRHNTWALENLQRNLILKGVDIQESDVVMLSDVDEIPDPQYINKHQYSTVFCMNLYYYYYNNRSIGPADAQWLGTATIKGMHLLNGSISCLQELRDNRHRLSPIHSGWHFSYFGGEDFIQNKIKSIVEGGSVMKEFNLTVGDILNNFKQLKDLYGRDSINFSLVDIQKEYPEQILNILKQYPQYVL